MIRPAALADAAATASGRVGRHVRRTPIEMLSLPGSEPWLAAKCENFQVTGSFKARGAVNAVMIATERGVRRVVAASTGNHGAAVAYAGYRAGAAVRVFVPAAAEPAKVQAIRKWGALVEVVPGDPVNAELAARDAASEEVPYISPYNHPDVVAGQGTIGVELLEQIPDCDTVVAAVGGGGLVSGVAAVMKSARPEIAIVGVSPAHSAVMAESVARGEIVELISAPTLSDGTAGGIEPGAITFPLCQQLVDRWLTVTEDEIAQSMRSFIAEHHQLIEGSAAVALAGAARLAELTNPGNTVAILCGANVSADTLHRILH